MQLLVVAENNDCDIHGTKDSQLMRLLEETTLALQECPVIDALATVQNIQLCWFNLH